MKLITAPDSYNLNKDKISCFLAGGITKCNDWQKEVSDILRFRHNCDKLVCFNPRQKNFDITNPNASRDQINNTRQ